MTMPSSLSVKEYYVDPEDGEIQFFRVKELIRGDPIFMRIVSDKRGVRGGRYKVCPLHRDQRYLIPAKRVIVKSAVGRCKTCTTMQHGW